MKSHVLFNFAGDETRLTIDERRWHREVRSSWLRLIVLIILIINLLVGEREGNLLFHVNVIAGYTAATGISLVLALTRRGPLWIGSAFVVVDAMLVVALFHEHLFGPSSSLYHSLTPPSLAVAFLLLNHVALRLRPRLVLLFAVLVIVGWFVLLGVSELHAIRFPSTHGNGPSTLLSEAAMGFAFAFAAFVGYLLTQDHNILLRSALKTERRRLNLSRFFSPKIVTELEAKADTLGLERRDAAVMFVDLRSFTHFSENVPLEAVGEMLAEYRELVTSAVFDHGGTIDKFIGDGVMALFGQPKPQPDDAERALGCAMELRNALRCWKDQRRSRDKPALNAVIALHMGPVIGGVLRSRQHDEFTVFGDTVNVAERLERLSKVLGASLVISGQLLAKVRAGETAAPWIWQDAAVLEGRTGTLRVAYLP